MRRSAPMITAESTSIAKLARYESRVSDEVRSANEILDELLKEFWLGRLRVGERPAAADRRLNILKAMNRNRRHVPSSKPMTGSTGRSL